MTPDQANTGISAPTTDIPFPYDVETTHPLDSYGKDALITKSSKNGYRVELPANDIRGPYTSDGNPWPEGDVLAHLPVGARLVIGDEGDTRIGASIPATDTVPQVGAFGKNIFTAIRALWPWLVDGGFAVLPVETQSEPETQAETPAESAE